MSQPVETPEANAPATENNTPQEGTGTAPESKPKLTYEQLESELAKTRQEAASRRVALREQEEAAKKWKDYEESQKTELQKLQDQLAERDKRIAEKELEVTRSKIAKQYNVADDDLDLLVGDEDNMKRLAERLGQKEQVKPTPAAELMAGNRGKPVGANTNSTSVDDWIRGNAR